MFKHKTSGIIFANRKQAVKLLGQNRYKRLLSNGEFEFEIKDNNIIN